MAKRVALRAKRTGSESAKAFQDDLRRAVAAVIEPLERRVMLTASPQISGTAIADAGAVYSLSLAANSNATVNSWAINWGDGSGVNHLSGNPSSATHVFSAAGSYDVTGSVTDGDGTYSANDKPLSVYPTSAAYVGSDTTTLGTWVGTYGAEGSYIPEYGSNLPAYAQLTSSGQQEGVWQFYSMDTRAPVQTPGTWRIAAYDSSATSFSYNLNFTDGNAHQLAMYAIDFDALNRAETVTITDANTHATLDSQSVSDFSGGRYLVWNLQGHVTITVANDGGPNAVVSGLFFGPPVDPALQAPSGLAAARGSSAVTLSWDAESAGGVAGYNVYRQPIDGSAAPVLLNSSPLTSPNFSDVSAPADAVYYKVEAVDAAGEGSAPAVVRVDTATSAASFVGSDVATQGTWVGTYGSVGIAKFGGADGNILPDYIDLTDNGLRQIWQYGATQTAAMQNTMDPNGRNAACDYSLGTLALNVNLTDDQAHQVAIYMVDWDHQGRQQTVQVSNADTGAILDTRTVSNFEDGQWLVWNLQGHVTISFTSTVPGMSAVISGLLLDPADTLRPAAPANLTAAAAAGAVQLQWSANQEGDLAGYNVYRRSSFSGPFVQLNTSGPLSSPSYTDASPPFGVVCYYRVVAVDTAGRSSFPSSVATSSSAGFLGTDASTQGSWVGTYGTDGYYLGGNWGAVLPAYALLKPTGQQNGLWQYQPSNGRALVQWQGMRMAADDYSTTSFSYDLDLTDGHAHQVALYVVDYDYQNRVETIQVNDAVTGALLSPAQTVSNFSNGQYLLWNLQGHVTITVTCVSGPTAVVSGLFFDPAGDPSVPKPTGLTATRNSNGVSLAWTADGTGLVAGYNVYRQASGGGTPVLLTATPLTQSSYLDPSALPGTAFYYVEAVGVSDTPSQRAIIQADALGSATFIEQDLDTQGSWVGTYGLDGYAMLGGYGTVSLPDYVQYSENGNSYLWQYTSGSGTPVAMQKAPYDLTDRIASTEYHAGSLDVNLTLTDGQPHEVSLYMMDFDDEGRQQTIQLSDADTGAVLDTRTVSNFQDGVWLVWNLQGHVTISITAPSGPNAVLSGIMFGPPGSSGPATPTNLSAIDTPSGVQMQWTASTAADVVGYNVYRRSSATGPFTQLNSVPLPGTSYTDTTAPSNSANFYQVVAVIADGRTSAPATVVPSSIALVRADAGTQGSWVGVYGADGFDTFGEWNAPASYAQTRMWGGQYYYNSWNSTDVRALQVSSANPIRTGSGYGATNSFSIDLNLTDGQTHQVALYLLDWQQAGLSETVQVLDAASGQLLNTQSVSNFNTGLWLVWMLSGHVTLQITGVGGSNCVAGGICFDTPPVTRPAAPSGLTATSTPSGVLLQWAANTEANLAGYDVYRRLDISSAFTLLNSSLLSSPSYDDTTAPQGQVAYYRVVAVNTIGQGSTASSVTSTPSSISSSFARLVAMDKTTQGNWQNVYGSDGYTLLDAYNSLPSYAVVDANGSQGYAWSWSSSDARAIEAPAWNARVATSAYANTTFTIDLNLIDSQTHQVALYLLDWDTSNLRTEIVQVSDAATGTVLDTRSVSDFSAGVWLVWELQGHVDITIRSTNGYSAVATAIMFAPSTPGPSSDLSATPLSAQQVTLSWSAAQGLVSGYDVQRSTDGVNFSTIAAGVQGTTYHDLAAQPDTTYTYQVRAETGGVESAPTNSATATTPAAAPPATPTGLTATPTGPNAVSLNWKPVDWATTITIDRLDPNGSSTPIATLDGSATSFDDNSTSNPPQEDTTYTYHVTATNQYSPADPDPASVQCTTPLAVPSNLTLTRGQDSNGNPQITVSWSNKTGDQNALVQIERSTDGSNFTDLALPPEWDYSSSSYTDTGLAPATHYWYRVQAVDRSASLVSALVSADTTTASASSNDPSVPTLSAVSASEIDLTWDIYTPDDGKTVTALEVDRSTDGVNFMPVVSDLDPSSTSYNDTGLSADTQYWYVIRAIESDGSTPASAAAAAWTAPVAPQNLAVAGSPTEIDLSWTYSGDASSAIFRIMRKGPDDASYTQLGPGQNGMNYRDTSSIIAGGNYLYYVIAVAGDNATLSAPSNTADATATLSSPTGLTATAYDASSVVLNWNPVVGATEYDILRQGPGDTQLVQISTTTTIPFYDSTVQGQSNYTYQVVAKDVIDGQTSYQASSADVSVTTPPVVADAPTNLSAVSSPGQIALSWSAPAGPVTGYNLWRSVGVGSTNFVPIALDLQTPAYTDTQLVPGLTYTYYVQADNAGALSTASATLQATAVPDQPSGLTVTGVSPSLVALAWSDSTGALDYSVLREGPGETSYSPIGTASGGVYTDATVSPNQTYSYEVAAFDAGGESVPSASVIASTSAEPPPTPTGFFVSSSDATSVSLAWNASAGAILYQILRRGIGDNDFIVIGSSYQPSYIDTAVTAGDTYGYRVVAVNNSGASAPSQLAFARPPAIAPSAPSDLTLTDDLDGTVTLSWSASAGAVTAYHVQRSIDGMGFVQIAADVQGTSYVDTAPPGAELSYRVSAENAGSFSDFSNVASITLTPAPVAGLTVSAITTTSLTLSWAAPAGAFQYTVLRMGPGDSSYQPIAANIVPPEFTDTSVSAGSTYSYEVIAINPGGNSQPSSPVSITIPAPAPSIPSGLTADAATSTQVTLSWAASTGAVTAYHLERSADGGNFTEINSDVQATTYTDSGLQPDTSYTYRVRAENDGTFSDYSATASVTTPAASAPAMPANLTAIASLDGIALQWSANTEDDLAGYDILRSASASGPFTQLNAQPLTAPAYDDSSAPAGSTSYYQVQAVDTSGLLSTAATASAIRPASVASTPANLAAAQVSAAGVLLTWTGPQGVTYNVYRDGQPIATGIQSAAYLDTGASAGASHSYTVSSTDNSGNTSAPSAALALTTPASSSSYDSTPPTEPTGLTASPDQNQPDSQIDLAWSAATDNVAVSAYVILRDGVQVGVTSGLTFNDTNLTPGSHTYSVIAFDADDSQSPPVTVSGSTGADQTPPNAPFDVQVTAVSSTSVTLNWVQPWDNVGVDHYDVTRSSNSYPYTVDLGTTTTPSITASGLSAGTPYSFNITAYDAAGNKSSAASASATTTGTVAVDQAANQYIPQVWQNYFYNTLTAALRQKITQLPTGGPSAVTIPHASGWISVVSPSYSQQSRWSPAAAGLLSHNLFAASNVYFTDLNGNGLLDPNEMASVVTAASSTTSPVWYVGANSNGIYTPGQDILLPDPWMIQGTTGQYEYCDLTGSGQYSAGDPVWSGGSVYQTGDTVIAGSPTAGMHGRTNGIYSYNAGGSSGPLIWADPDNFRQDFAAFYSAMDALVPHFASGQAYPNDAYTVGSLLASIGATPVAGNGTISVQTDGTPPEGSTVTGSGTHFTTQLVPGDNIQINGNWYPIAPNGVTSDTQLTLAQSYYGPSLSGASFSLINWTKVPATSDAATGLSFHFTRGQPDANTLLFPQQFQQLHDALQHLGSYPRRYNQWLFDIATSQQFISVATNLINASDSLFGSSSNPDSSLETALQDGQADPGSVFTLALVEDLRDVADGILSVVVARKAGGPGGWDTDTNNNPILFADSDQMTAALPAFSDALATRLAGGFSGTSNVLPLGSNPPIDDVQVTEVQSLLTAIENNGLWVWSGTPLVTEYKGTENDYAGIYGGLLPPNSDVVTDVGFLPPKRWLVSLINQYGPTTGNAAWDQVASSNFVSAGYYGNQVGVPPFPYTTVPNPVLLQAGYSVSGVELTAQVPVGNPNGGNVPIRMAAGPMAGDINMSGWTWNSTQIIENYSTDDISGILSGAKYGQPGPLTPPDYLNGSVSVTTGPVDVAPHLYYLSFDGALTSMVWQAVDPYYIKYNYYVQVFVSATPAVLYGQVPVTNDFSYSPSGSAPAPAPIAPPPTDPLPLTTAMDYFNVMPDNGIDGIVNTPANLSSFGNDTGTVTFTAQNGMAQTLLPVDVSAGGTLPVNGYLIQGDFGSEQDSVGDLLSQDIAVPNSSQDGTPWAYSLDTHVRINLLVDDPNGNHAKRIEVIRPGGNAVVFDFAWDATTGMFSPTGTPEGWKGRDDQQTFVLRALDPTNDSSLNYELLFANGIVQTFNGNLFTGGGLSSVSDSATGLTQGVSGGPLSSLLTHGIQDTSDNPRYNMTFNWANGNLSEADYQTKGTTPQTIATAVTYGGDGGNNVTALNKSDGGSAIPQFSFQLSDPTTLTTYGAVFLRSGSLASGSVTIRTTPTADASQAAGSYTAETYIFNDHNLITSDALTFDDGNGNVSTATTSFQYQDDSGLYDNGSPKWSKLTKVTNPDGSWVEYEYDDPETGPTTGWVTATLTPFESGTGNVETYGYDPSQSGNGQAPDPSLLVQPPDTVTDSLLGTQTGEMFNNYDGTKIVTRQALGDNDPDWSKAGVFSTTTISAYDASDTESISGNLSEDKSGSGGGVSYATSTDWLGLQSSYTSDTYNAFGILTSETAYADGQPNTNYNATSSDAFGRTTQASLSGGLTESFNYYDTDWFGPHSVIGADGTETDYTYTPLGQVATEVDGSNGQYPIKTSFVYDAMGNVVSTTVSPTDGSSSLTDTFAYDAQGRQTSETDNAGGSDATANRVTSTVYTNDGTYNISTTTNPDGSTSTEKDYLDGSVAGTGGTAEVATSYAYGVVSDPDAHDANGNWLPQGSTYATASTDGGQNTSTTYSNVLGEDYLSVQSAPGAGAQASASQFKTVDSVTKFDANQRPYETTNFDGSKDESIYDPTTGQLGASWTSMDGSSTFDSSDSKTLYKSSYGGSSTTLLSTSGNQTDQLTYTNGGLTTTENLNGLSTTSNTVMTGSGTYRVTTSNPDGTSQTDSYSSGLLVLSRQLGTTGAQTSYISYAYNPNQTLQYSTDYTGVTNYTEFQDGTEKSVQAPGQTTGQSVTSINSGTEDPTGVTNSNGSTNSQSENALGQTTNQSGAGIIASKYGYNADGQLTSLTTYPGGDTTNADDPKAATTGWTYDPATGLMTSKHYADGTQDTYKYNAAGQLKTVIEPGMSESFGYNAAGIQTSSTAIDSSTGLAGWQVQALDDQGRPMVTTSIDNGQIRTETNTYTPLGQPQNETFGSAGNVTVAHGYYPAVPPTGVQNQSPNALASLTIQNLPNGQPNAQTTYAYDPSSKRLQTITVNGVTFTIGYQFNSTSQIASITTSVAGQAGAAVTTTLSPFSGQNGNASMLGGINVTAGATTLYSAGGITYNPNGQILTDNINTVDSSGNSLTNEYVYGYGSGTGDNGSDANSLTSVTDNGTVKETYAYDGVGNRVGTSYGNANSLNEYANDTYNQRGDETDDGTEHFTWDANDQLIGEAPDHPVQGSTEEQMGYDSQGRMLWQTVATYVATSSSFQLAYTHQFVWDGQNLVAELNADGTLIANFTWGPGTGGSQMLLAITDDTLATPKTEVAVEDASGSLAELVNPLTGAVDASYSYGPFGENFIASGPEANLSPFGFQLMMRDPSGKWYDHARWYDADQGRFMSRDPMGESADENLYRPFENDPINNSDPTGLLVSQFGEYMNELGKKYVDPWVISKIQNHVGSSAATSAAEFIAAGREFGIQIAIRSDGLRLAGQLVDGVLDGSIAHSIDERIAYAKKVASQPGGNGGALAAFTGMDKLPAAVYNAYPYPANGRPTPVGGAWQRFQTGGEGTVNTLNTFVAAGGGIAAVDDFYGNIKLGMQEQAASNALRQLRAQLPKATQDFSGARNLDYPLPSTDIGTTGFVRTNTPWQRVVIEKPGMIDWDLVRPTDIPNMPGVTNAEAARLGYAPGRINPVTGQWDDVVMHHLLDDPRGAIMQAWRSDHTAFHQMVGRESNYWRDMNPSWSDAWRREVPAYWKWRAGAANPPVQPKLWLPGDPK